MVVVRSSYPFLNSTSRFGCMLCWPQPCECVVFPILSTTIGNDVAIPPILPPSEFWTPNFNSLATRNCSSKSILNCSLRSQFVRLGRRCPRTRHGEQIGRMTYVSISYDLNYRRTISCSKSTGCERFHVRDSPTWTCEVAFILTLPHPRLRHHQTSTMHHDRIEMSSIRSTLIFLLRGIVFNAEQPSCLEQVE